MCVFCLETLRACCVWNTWMRRFQGAALTNTHHLYTVSGHGGGTMEYFGIPNGDSPPPPKLLPKLLVPLTLSMAMALLPLLILKSSFSSSKGMPFYEEENEDLNMSSSSNAAFTAITDKNQQERFSQVRKVLITCCLLSVRKVLITCCLLTISD